MNQLQARSLFDRLVARGESLDLARTALAVAAEEDPDLDIEEAAGRLDALAGEVLDALPDDADARDRFGRVSDVLFRVHGFDGEGCDFEDPDSSFLQRVLDRRTGLPITLSIVLVEVGRRAGLVCTGVGFPGHFLARVKVDDAELLVDAFRHGRVVTASQLDRRLREASGGRQHLQPSMLVAASPLQVIARLLRNLKNLYVRRHDLPRAWSAVDRLLVATPDVAEDVRDRGLLSAALGGESAARGDLARYLELAPLAADADEIRRRLATLAHGRHLLN